MIQRKSKFTTEQLVTAYKLKEQRKKPKEIADVLGLTVNDIDIIHRRMVRNLKKKALHASTSQEWKDAVMILKDDTAEVIEEPKVLGETTVNALQELEEAFANLHKKTAAVIVSEVESRTKAKIAEKEEQLKAQKGKYEQELLKLQAIIANMKDSSVLGVVKKAWGGA